MKIHTYRSLTALALAAVMTAGYTVSVLADEPEMTPGEGYTQFMEALQDNHMEYDELTELVKRNYGPIKSSYDMIDTMEIDQADMATAMRVVADDYMSQAQQLADTLGSGNSNVMRIVSGARQLRSGAQSIDRSIDRSNSKKSVDRQANAVISGAEILMNQYETYLSRRRVLEKALEVAQTAQNIQQSLQSQGLAVDADVLSAAAQLSSTRSQLEQVNAGIDQIYKNLCYFTGWDRNAESIIGPVPAADVSSIAALDLNADTEKAVNNNYSLITMRSGSGAGMTDVQIRTTNKRTQVGNKMRTVQNAEDELRSDMKTLYDTIIEKKAAYDAAGTALQSAQLTWNAAQIQYQNGTISQIQYMQQEMAYLQAQSGYKCADLSLQQAVRNYQWAVKGVSVSAG